MWIDSHCHLNHAHFEGQRPEDIISDFKGQGIDGCVTICCRISEELPELLDICKTYTQVNCSIGTHPCDASHEGDKKISLDELVKLAKSNDKIVAIGESGLDYYWDKADVQDQKNSFRKHIQAAQQTGLPLIVHARDADNDIADMLEEEYKNAPYDCVMHCFSSGQKLAERALNLGFYISFSGIVTFKNSKTLQEIAKIIPDDKILVETDAPFLAPTPYRGKINKPSYVRHTGEFLAKLRNMDVNSFAKLTSDNFFTLFTKAKFKA
ncbi:MAG: TatD family hydrolase [Bdellovibrionales bacterium]